MRNASTPIVTLLAAAVVAAAVGLMAGCESKPAAPDFDNPWDPAGPTGGDALNLRATAKDTTITITWTQPQDMGIVAYLVSHALDSGGPWEDLGEVDHTVADVGLYRYVHRQPSLIHYFRVQAFTETDFSIVSYTRVAAVIAPPRLVPASGFSNRASRYVDLAVTVNKGDSLRLADNDTFAGAVTIPVAALGVPQIVPWDLGPADEGAEIVVHVVSVDLAGIPSPAASLKFKADFDPEFEIVGEPTTVATRTLDLAVPIAGVVNQRFALKEGALAGTPWQAPLDTVRGFLLDNLAGTQTVWGEFAGDFGYTTIHSVQVKPDLLTTAGFAIDAGNDHIVDSRFVTTTNDAVATLMRFAEDGNFAGVPWQPYADTAYLTLSAGAGRKVVYAQFRNDWADSPILTDYVDLVVQPASVSFLAPAAGSTLAGGTPLQVRGTALAGSGTTRLDSVRVDVGNGWETVTGLESWSYLWDVPTAAADSSVSLRARAWVTDTGTSAPDSATATISVTIAAGAAR